MSTTNSKTFGQPDFYVMQKHVTSLLKGLRETAPGVYDVMRYPSIVWECAPSHLRWLGNIFCFTRVWWIIHAFVSPVLPVIPLMTVFTCILSPVLPFRLSINIVYMRLLSLILLVRPWWMIIHVFVSPVPQSEIW